MLSREIYGVVKPRLTPMPVRLQFTAFTIVGDDGGAGAPHRIALMCLGFGLVAFGKWWASEEWREVAGVVADGGPRGDERMGARRRS